MAAGAGGLWLADAGPYVVQYAQRDQASASIIIIVYISIPAGC